MRGDRLDGGVYSGRVPLWVSAGVTDPQCRPGRDLYQDIYRQIVGRELLLHNQNIEGVFGNHSIDIEGDTFLYDIYQQKIGWVNSFHHQAIRNLSPSLRAIAWSKDGIIEAAIHRDNPKIFGVQWHPEKMWDKDVFSIKLFEYFVGLL